MQFEAKNTPPRWHEAHHRASGPTARRTL